MIYTVKSFIMLFLMVGLLSSCGGDKKTPGSSDTSDLRFSEATTADAYVALVIKAIRTNRGQIVAEQFDKGINVIPSDIKKTAYGFGQAISRKDWDLEINHKDLKNDMERVSYAWFDKRNREAVKIIIDLNKPSSYRIEKLNFDSRIEVLESKVYPQLKYSPNLGLK